MNTQYLSLRSPALYARIVAATFALAAVFIYVPIAAHAADADPSADIDAKTLTVGSGKKARITGTTEDVTKVRVVITSDDTDKVVYKSKILKVKKETWKATSSKKLKDGTYSVSVLDYSNKDHDELVEKTLTVGKTSSAGTVTISSIPLLGGGTAAPGQIVPISYLQVRNTGKSALNLKGFWVEQAGTAQDASVVGFSSVDDKGGNRTETTTGLSKGKAFVPSTAVLAPGERKLFTLKAQLSAFAALGQSLMLNVTGVEGAKTGSALPIQGTTWVISR